MIINGINTEQTFAHVVWFCCERFLDHAAVSIKADKLHYLLNSKHDMSALTRCKFINVFSTELCGFIDICRSTKMAATISAPSMKSDLEASPCTIFPMYHNYKPVLT